MCVCEKATGMVCRCVCVCEGYRYGFRVTSSNNNKVLLMLNARSEHDRSRFVDDLKEAILEVRTAILS